LDHWTRMARLGVRAAAWWLWVALCWVLELPIHHPHTEPGWGKDRAGTQEQDGMGLGLGSHPALSPAPGPTLACKPTALARFLLQHCCSLARPRLAPWPRGDPHLQTLSSFLLGGLTAGDQGQEVNFTRDHLLLKDGGLVALDWAVGGGEAVGWERGKEHHPGGKALGCHTSTPPILLLIPHYWGGVTPHLRGLCRMALRQGFYSLVFHRRGTGGCPLTTPRLTEYGDSVDLMQTVAYVRSRHPSSVLVAVSEGSGSGLLLSYLGECGSSSYLTAAACISPVLQGQLWFDTPLPPLYRWAVLIQRKLQLSRYASALSGVLDVDRALHCSSLRDFEETLFCSSYWERNEPLRDADEVAVPVLCLCSRDDPLLPPPSTLPLALFQNNPYFLLALTETGGHCGFGLEEGGQGEGEVGGNWSSVSVLEYFRVVAEFLKGEERKGMRWGCRGSTGMGRGGQRGREEGQFTWQRSYTR
uniref:Abhydrolase domain containing 15 n=1 Tax=Oncorhynchus tshawytscha TaxID=74940 RepID=A0AAZ3PDM3_ONCTS